MAFTVWWKSMSGRKQESERSRMEIADTEAAVPRAARPKPNSTVLDCDTSPRIALNPWRKKSRPVCTLIWLRAVVKGEPSHPSFPALSGQGG